MKYQRIEDLPVWKAAIDLAVKTFTLTGKEGSRGCGDLKNQMERSSLSISNNIAEGFERGTTQELLTFIYIARGSAGELRSMLLFLGRLPNFNNLKCEISDLRVQAESLSRQLRAWADSLQNTDIKGATLFE
jgi:four helix bundle protein